MRKTKLSLTATAVICALSGYAGKTEAPKDQAQAASEAKTRKAEEAGKEAGKSENAGGTEEAERTETPKNRGLFVCLISGAPAGIPFTDLTWIGFERVGNEYGTQVELIEALDRTEYPERIRAMAETGANPIRAMFDMVNEVAMKLAPKYPETMLYLIDSSLDTKYDNVANVYVDSLKPASVSGFVAAKTTQLGTIGWIGSLDIPVINRFRDAYLAGAKYADPDVAVQTTYVGDDDDTVKAEEQTRITVSQGADIIFQTASLAGPGVIQDCSDAGIKCIGVGEWRGSIDSCVFWFSLTDINEAVSDFFTTYKGGKFTTGRTNYGIKTQSAIYDDRDYGKLPDDMKAELDELLAVVRSSSPSPEDLPK